jgi:hypothetical protein
MVTSSALLFSAVLRVAALRPAQVDSRDRAGQAGHGGQHQAADHDLRYREAATGDTRPKITVRLVAATHAPPRRRAARLAVQLMRPATTALRSSMASDRRGVRRSARAGRPARSWPPG